MLTAEEKQKKVKNLQKKLKQINQIKSKKDAGEVLNADQLAKIASEVAILNELQALS